MMWLHSLPFLMSTCQELIQSCSRHLFLGKIAGQSISITFQCCIYFCCFDKYFMKSFLESVLQRTNLFYYLGLCFLSSSSQKNRLSSKLNSFPLTISSLLKIMNVSLCALQTSRQFSLPSNIHIQQGR